MEGYCEPCPAGYQISPNKRVCDLVVMDEPANHLDRIKLVQFLSISPLDRLLNQRDANDEVDVTVGCKGINGNFQTNNYSFNLPNTKINKLTCHDGTEPSVDWPDDYKDKK